MLGNTGAALMLAQGVMHLIKQKKEANDAQLKRSMAELTSDFRAKLAEHSTRAEAEKGEITRRFEAEAAGTAESSAQVRLTKALVLASSGLHPSDFLGSCSAIISCKMV